MRVRSRPKQPNIEKPKILKPSTLASTSIFLVVWLLAFAPLLGQEERAEQGAARAAPTDHGALVAQYEQARQAFAARLEALAVRCDGLGLQDEAAQTRGWLIPRDPGRQYVFLPPAAAPPPPGPEASEASRYWWQHFRAARTERAEQLVQLARDATGIRPALAYQWLHEALREDPELTVAREALGYRRSGDGWTYAGDAVGSSQGKAALAEFGLPPRGYYRIDSANFRILTDADEETGRRMARELEDFHCVWRQVFYEYWGDGARLARQLEKGAPDARPRSDKHRIIWYRDREKYLSVLRRAEPQIDKTLGIYLDSRRTAYLYGDPTDMRASWLHEVTHQLFAETGRTVTEVGKAGNVWVVEGLALHMESLRRGDEFAMLGGLDARRLQFARYRALTDKFYVPAAQFARLDRYTVQHDPNIGALYSQAAGLTSYWMTAESGARRSAFVDYVAAVYHGRDTADTLTELAGVSWDEVDKGYANYLQVTDAELAHCQPVADLVLCHALISDEGFRQVPVENLEWLDLGFTRITDASLRRLAAAPQLKKLTLERTKVTAQGLAVLSQLPQLEYLDLSGLPVDDQVLANLARLEKLESLWLSETQVTDAGLMQLAALKRLKELDVTGTAVTAAALAKLREQLPLLAPN